MKAVSQIHWSNLVCKITCRVRLLCSIAPANNWRFIPQNPSGNEHLIFLTRFFFVRTCWYRPDSACETGTFECRTWCKAQQQELWASTPLSCRCSLVRFFTCTNDSVDLTVFCIFTISYLNKFDYKRWFTYLKCGISSLPSTKGHFPALKAKIESNIWKSNCKLHRRLGARKHVKTRSTCHHTWFKLSATPQNASLSAKQIRFRGLLRGSLRRAGEHRGIYRSQVNIWYVWQYFTPCKLYYFSMQDGWIHPKAKLGTKPRNKNWESTFLSH